MIQLTNTETFFWMSTHDISYKQQIMIHIARASLTSWVAIYIRHNASYLQYIQWLVEVYTPLAQSLHFAALKKNTFDCFPTDVHNLLHILKVKEKL